MRMMRRLHSTDSNEETIDSTADRFNRAAGLYLEIFDSLASTPIEGIQLTSGEFFYQDSFEWQLWAIDNQLITGLMKQH